MEETGESADKCHEPETHDEVARDDVNNATMDPAQVREARKAEMEHLSEDASAQEGTSSAVQGRDREDADQSQVDRHKRATRSEPEVSQSSCRKRV